MIRPLTELEMSKQLLRKKEKKKKETKKAPKEADTYKMKGPCIKVEVR